MKGKSCKNLMRFASCAPLAIVLAGNAAYTQSLKAPRANTSAEGASQQLKNRNKEKFTSRSIEIQNLISDAHLAQVEFGIDALIRIAESNRVRSRQWKMEILEEAFRLTADVQQPVRRKVVALPAIPVDTKPGYLSYAFDLKLDRLSLRSRILEAMLRLDPQRTRVLLSEVNPDLRLKPLTCEDSLLYEVSDFYTMVSKVVGATFTLEERKQGNHLRFVLPYVEAVSSPSQVAPVIRLMLSVNPNPFELMNLVGSLSLAMKKMPLDDRSFSYAVHQTIPSAFELFKAYQAHDLPTNELSLAFRAFLTKNLQSSRCAENKNVDSQFLPQIVKFTNSRIFLNTPLSMAEVQAERFETSATIDWYWTSLESRRLQDKIKELRFGLRQPINTDSGQGAKEQSSESEDAPDVTTTESEKGQTVWQQKAAELLNDLEQWNSNREKSEMDYFHQKNVLYTGLLEMCPSGNMRERILRSYVSFLANHNSQKENRIEWGWYAGRLMTAARMTENEDRNVLLDALINSNSPTLRLYSNLAKLQL